MKKFKLPYYDKYGKIKKVSLIIEDGLYTTPTIKNFLRGYAAGMWGKVERASTVLTTDDFILMDFTCEGHGGYVLFSKEEVMGIVADCAKNQYSSAWFPDFYLYCFEEDANWALLYKLCDAKAWEKVEKDWIRGASGRRKGQLAKTAEDALSRWNMALSLRLKPVIKA